ncbi:MAG: DUF1059 domain-containing protein [Actinomycetota bacterium]
MARIINCVDGVVIRGETDEELLANAREHIRTAHPEMAGTMTDADLLAMATEV